MLPFATSNNYETLGVNTGTTTLTSITSHATSANVKNASWTNIGSPSTIDAYGITFIPYNNGSAFPDFLVDLQKSDGTPIITNFLVSGRQNNNMYRSYFPIFIPKGTQLQARCQASIANRSMCVGVILHGITLGTFPKYSVITTYGANTADSGGTPIDAGASAGTKGSWNTITAGTTRDIFSAILGLGIVANSALPTAGFLIDLSVSSSNQVIVANLWSQMDTNETMSPAVFHLPLFIPKGTRIDARCQSSTNDVTDRIIDLVLYGVD